MQHKAEYWLRNCLPSEVEAFAEAVDATVLAAVERVLGVSFDPSTYGTDTNMVVTDFLAELLHDPDPMAAEVATLSEDAMAMARNMLHLPTRLKGAAIRRMATVRDAAFIGCMNAILPSFLSRNSGTNTPTLVSLTHSSDARQMEREVEAVSGSQKEMTAFLDHANNSRLRNEVCALPATCIDVRREMDDLFQQAVPLGNTVPRDELKDLVPEVELSLPAFNVVTGSYDPRSLKSTLLEFKTMRACTRGSAGLQFGDSSQQRRTTGPGCNQPEQASLLPPQESSEDTYRVTSPGPEEPYQYRAPTASRTPDTRRPAPAEGALPDLTTSPSQRPELEDAEPAPLQQEPTARRYSRRRKCCATCMTMTSVISGGVEKRYCQQCSTLHLLEEFDGVRRSCRKGLQKHGAKRKSRGAS
eukprot:jgi/Tetstr1/428670/TSEL_018658.t1